MKGITPLIAAILLIAFTVAMGGIISVWLIGFTSTQTTTVETGTEKQIQCAYSSLKIEEARYQTGTPSNVTVYVVYISGREDLGNITLQAIGGGFTNSSQTYFINDTLEPGEAFVGFIDTTSGASTPTHVRARALCMIDVPVIAECKSGQICMVAG